MITCLSARGKESALGRERCLLAARCIVAREQLGYQTVKDQEVFAWVILFRGSVFARQFSDLRGEHRGDQVHYDCVNLNAFVQKYLSVNAVLLIKLREIEVNVSHTALATDVDLLAMSM